MSEYMDDCYNGEINDRMLKAMVDAHPELEQYRSSYPGFSVGKHSNILRIKISFDDYNCRFAKILEDLLDKLHEDHGGTTEISYSILNEQILEDEEEMIRVVCKATFVYWDEYVRQKKARNRYMYDPMNDY